jgi:hypothetical protein
MRRLLLLAALALCACRHHLFEAPRVVRVLDAEDALQYALQLKQKVASANDLSESGRVAR